MCRVYSGKDGSYIRLCYRFGTRKGERVYYEGDPPLSPTGHYCGLRGTSKFQCQNGSKQKRRCQRCGSPLVSKHDLICQACKVELGRAVLEAAKG